MSEHYRGILHIESNTTTEALGEKVCDVLFEALNFEPPAPRYSAKASFLDGTAFQLSLDIDLYGMAPMDALLNALNQCEEVKAVMFVDIEDTPEVHFLTPNTPESIRSKLIAGYVDRAIAILKSHMPSPGLPKYKREELGPRNPEHDTTYMNGIFFKAQKRYEIDPKYIQTIESFVWPLLCHDGNTIGSVKAVSVMINEESGYLDGFKGIVEINSPVIRNKYKGSAWAGGIQPITFYGNIQQGKDAHRILQLDGFRFSRPC